jgi:hypothetical protein
MLFEGRGAIGRIWSDMGCGDEWKWRRSVMSRAEQSNQAVNESISQATTRHEIANKLQRT